MTRVLVVEDNGPGRYLLESILAGHGFEVEAVGNGAEALEAAGRTPPDVVIADILMPTMDGFELCRRWRADERLRDIPFIFYTATYTDTRDERFALSLGGDRFLIKPQPPHVLVKVVRELVEEAGRRGGAGPSPGPAVQEAEVEVLREYSDVLFRKLNDKVQQLEEKVAELQRLRDELQVQTTFLDMVVENLPDMIFVKDARDLRFVRVNRAGEEFLGLLREEMVGKRDHDLFPRDEADRFVQTDREALAGRTVVDIPRETVTVRGRGERILHARKIPVFSTDGEPLYLVGIAEEITERVQAEERLRRSERRFQDLYEGMIDAFVRVDMDGRILEYNRAFREMLGYSDEELSRTTYLDLTPERWRVREQEIVRNQILPLGHSVLYEKEYFRRDGTLVPVELRTSLLVDEDGRPAGMYAIVRDITARKRTEEEIRLANRKLALMTDVTYQDIQNKVTVLRGYLEMARKASDPQEHLWILERQQNVLESLHALIQKTKDYQQMGIGGSRWTLVETTFRVQHSLLDGWDSVSLECNLDGLEILVDPQIERVFSHLIENALRHGGGVTRLTVGYRETPEGLVLVVADNGVGVPEEEKERLFERFPGGRGRFGLFFVREFLSLSGMTIVENGAPGEGARFEIGVPRGLYRFSRERAG